MKRPAIDNQSSLEFKKLNLSKVQNTCYIQITSMEKSQGIKVFK